MTIMSCVILCSVRGQQSTKDDPKPTDEFTVMVLSINV